MMDPETSESPVSSDSEPWEVQVWVAELEVNSAFCLESAKINLHM